uniref:transketolase n=1 Tax=Phallusia mammillata TaxID=59560 RepID=A0A6F9DMA4_9ASCI|nr:transketolase-like [Phallusia mammillata]
MEVDSYSEPCSKTVHELNNIANRIRINSILSTSKSNSGHPTSSSSCAEILSVLFFRVMKYKVDVPRDLSADRFVMSKGHACPALYAAWVETGHMTQEQLMTLREFGSVYEGHPTPKIDFIDVATGSLGQGLGMAVGMAYVGKYIDKSSYRVFCLLGDGEMAEGAVWEAMAFASYYKLDNLVAIIDVNRLGQSEPTALGHQTDVYRKRAEAFGWNSVEVDGHCVNELSRCFHNAEMCKQQPTCVVAKTMKGKNMVGQENLHGFHGKPVAPASKDEILTYLRGLIGDSGIKLSPGAVVEDTKPVNISNIKLSSPPDYELGKKLATRAGYGKALVKIGQSCDRVYSLDGDMKNSTFAQDYKKAFPDRFIECFIAEQNMVGVGIGMATRDRTVVFISTFAAFLARAYDHIRMGAVCHTNINFFGSHCGISIGADGPSQMALEDIAMFRAVCNSTVLYPSDVVAVERAVELAANTKGICFIRGARAATQVVYTGQTEFKVGGAQVLKQKAGDKVTVVAGGVTLDEALKAYDILQGEGIGITLIDIFSVKPVDKDTILGAAKSTGGRLITVEDHYEEGGIGSAVAEALSGETGIVQKKLAVRGLPYSAAPSELLAAFEIDAAAIVKAVKSMM